MAKSNWPILDFAGNLISNVLWKLNGRDRYTLDSHCRSKDQFDIHFREIVLVTVVVSKINPLETFETIAQKCDNELNKVSPKID